MCFSGRCVSAASFRLLVCGLIKFTFVLPDVPHAEQEGAAEHSEGSRAPEVKNDVTC